jgi:hypothetical protein
MSGWHRARQTQGRLPDEFQPPAGAALRSAPTPAFGARVSLFVPSVIAPQARAGGAFADANSNSLRHRARHSNAREYSLHPMQGGTLLHSKEINMDDILSYFETNDTEGFKINSMVW